MNSYWLEILLKEESDTSNRIIEFSSFPFLGRGDSKSHSDEELE